MTATEQVRDEINFAVGRQDIKVPNIEELDTHYGGYPTLQFFHQLWKLNGFDPTTEKHYSQGGDLIPYSHELVIPAEPNRPLVFLRGTNIEYSRDVKEHQEWLSKNDRRFSGQPIRRGKEKHELLLPPQTMGKFIVALGVELEHELGGSGHTSWLDDPYKVVIDDQQVRMRHFQPEYDKDVDFNPTRDREITEREYSQFIMAGLARAAELLKMARHND